MNREDFEAHVLSGNQDAYVSDEGLQYLTTLPITVDESQGLEDPRRGTGHSLVSRALAGENDYTESELKERVRNHLTDGQRDIQKRNVTKNGQAATGILIISADYGYEAVATFD